MCPCGSGQTYTNCCGRFHSGGTDAPTALALMRARYTAFVMGNDAYLLASWHSATRPASLSKDEAAPPVKWLGLKIVAIEEGGESDTRGVVEFIARYKIQGRAYRMHERSLFRKEDGSWFYVEGDQL